MIFVIWALTVGTMILTGFYTRSMTLPIIIACAGFLLTIAQSLGSNSKKKPHRSR